jgi:hypothetical protein
MAAAWIELLFYWEAEFRANAGRPAHRPYPVPVYFDVVIPNRRSRREPALSEVEGNLLLAA